MTRRREPARSKPHAYRRRNRLVLFADVDVNTQVEAEPAGQKVVTSIIVRAANRKTVQQLSGEIRAAVTPRSSHHARRTPVADPTEPPAG
ncbi:hypothetical protein SAMN04488085_105177 [Geodermatophilus ruber]|uniref:Uncharacterized protein n=1 Tax=Geodermatophilus ruber TaxID=504800 RepID=A0A1I4E1J7_9ACTN|nr:hypothetical protein SAMN04488085_105177 [Geodermatophilus ruber]